MSKVKKRTDRSPHGDYAAPVLYAVMSDSDVGKTWDELNTWRYKAEYDGDEATIRRVAGSMGLDQSKLTVKNRPTLRATHKRLVQYRKAFPDRGIPLTERPIWAIVADDASLKLQNDRAAIWKAESKNHYARWDRVSDLLMDVAKAQRRADCHLHTSWHYDAYKPAERDEKGKLRPARKGGAVVLGPKSAKIMTHWWDTVVLAGEDEDRWPRPAAFLGMPPNSRHHTKDRHNFFRANRPLCTREVLIHLGYTIPSVSSREADFTARFAELAADTGPFNYAEVKDAFREPYQKAAARYGKQAVYLALYNGLARAQLQTGLSFFDDIFADDF